jgi:hypothetical protein
VVRCVGVVCEGLSDDAEDVGLVDDEEVFAVHLHFGAAVLGDEDLVALLHGEEGGDVLAFIVLAGAEREDFGLLGLFLGSVGQEDAACGLFFASGALDGPAV